MYPVEELLVGGAAGGKIASAAGKAIGELDLFFAGVVTPTKAGTVNAGKVSSEGLTVKLSAAEQSALRAIDATPNVQVQGMLREIVSDSYFQRNGYKALDGKCGSGNCFDGVYIKGDKIYIVEVKPLNADGTIKLSGASDNLPAQMTEGWITDAAKRLLNGSPAQREAGEKILQALRGEGGTLVKVVTGVNAKNMTILKLN